MSKQKIGRVSKMAGRIGLFSAAMTLLVGGPFRLLQEASVHISAQFVVMAIPIAIVVEMSAPRRTGRPSRILGN